MVCGTRRSAPWLAAALLVVVAGVVHLLACAHGPGGAGQGRVDALALASAAPAHAHLPPGGSAEATAGCATHHGAACEGADEPAAPAERESSAPQPGGEQSTLAVPPGVGACQAPVGRSPAFACGRAADPGAGRAALGVWRT
ncbi:hypothetical protein [Streptomyces radicis]|uniref:hypothetical protein n=1 Tax=Streptomyces radicis TaxID=1750517 RepID=UPI00160191EB|nr:hypothetical protein [Streptomyces radicis]